MVPTVATSEAGRMRRARAAQNFRRLTRPVDDASRHRWPVMRNPEITKKTSTPM